MHGMLPSQLVCVHLCIHFLQSLLDDGCPAAVVAVAAAPVTRVSVVHVLTNFDKLPMHIVEAPS